jgi:mannose-6-phosphate isomerase-like protein (cupin superfamily)
MSLVFNIEKATLENEDYRRVINTSGYQQLVLMSIPAGEDIDFEIHPYVDQFFRIESGTGEIRLGIDQKEIYPIKDATGIVIKHGTYHRVINTGTVPLKLYTIYSPPNHSPNKVEHVKPDEKKSDEKYKNILLNILSTF